MKRGGGGICKTKLLYNRKSSILGEEEHLTSDGDFPKGDYIHSIRSRLREREGGEALLKEIAVEYLVFNGCQAFHPPLHSIHVFNLDKQLEANFQRYL